MSHKYFNGNVYYSYITVSCNFFVILVPDVTKMLQETLYSIYYNILMIYAFFSIFMEFD